MGTQVGTSCYALLCICLWMPHKSNETNVLLVSFRMLLMLSQIWVTCLLDTETLHQFILLKIKRIRGARVA